MHRIPAPICRNHYLRDVSTWLILGILLVSISYVASAQKPTRRKTVASKAVSPKQGICGVVLEKRGNHMPSPDDPRPADDGQPIMRDVLIFPLLNASQVDMGENGFISSVRQAKPVKTIKSDSAGKFCVSLPAGRYSVIVREPKGLYANLSDTQNNIFPVTVKAGQNTPVNVVISHSAVF